LLKIKKRIHKNLYLLVTVRGGGYNEKVKEAEYSGNTMYSRIKMERDLLKLSQEGGRGDKGE
jgi:hypothetical protein